MSIKKLLKKKQKPKKKDEKTDEDLDKLFLEELEKEKIDCCGEDRYGI
ncbi:MAG: hypothetical protein ACTSX9_06375 [Candidatus Njordarchaeales archaeon]